MIRREETVSSFAPDSFQPEVRFIADAMLGRLARCLRFLGFDTLYFSGISDSRLVRMAREQGRAILTRDSRLVKIKGLENCLLIASDDHFQQLLETADRFQLKQFQFLSRCVACNGSLRDVADKSVVKDSVPEYVFLHNERFRKCADCGKVYWEGSHARKFRNEIKEIISHIDRASHNK